MCNVIFQGNMKLNRIALFLLVFFCIAAIGCNDKKLSKEFTFSPENNIEYLVKLKKASFRGNKKSKTMLVHFNLIIKNNSSSLYYFNQGELKFHLNSNPDSGHYIDSPASHLSSWEELKKGNTKLELYAVFKESDLNSNRNIVNIVNFGLESNLDNLNTITAEEFLKNNDEERGSEILKGIKVLKINR